MGKTEIVSKIEAADKLYSPQELAARWNMCSRAIINRFKDAPEILKFEGVAGRSYIRIPHSLVAECKYEKHLQAKNG